MITIKIPWNRIGSDRNVKFSVQGPYDHGSRSLHTLGSWTTIVRYIIQIQHCRKELWTGKRCWVCVHCDLDLGDVTLVQCHNTPLGHGHQFCEILSRLDNWERSYSPDRMWKDRQTDGRTDGRTDRHTDGQTGCFLYTSPKLCLRGYKIEPVMRIDIIRLLRGHRAVTLCCGLHEKWYFNGKPFHFPHSAILKLVKLHKTPSWSKLSVCASIYCSFGPLL